MRLANFFLPLVASLCCCLGSGWSQTPVGVEDIIGYPYIANYTPKQYGAHKQNWGLVQDSLGILYIANGDGILIYNGSDWQLLELPGQSMAASLAIDAADRIYVGGWGTFGYLRYDPSGRPQYQSLSDSLDLDSENISRVFGTLVTPQGVYFQTTEAVYRYREGEKIHIWEMGDKQLGKLFYVNNRVLLKWHYKGIFELIQDEWQLLPDSEQFGGVFVYAILPYKSNQLLFAINGSFLYVYDGKKFTPFASEAVDYFQQHRFYGGVQSVNGDYIFGTVNGGIVGIDPGGNLNLLINDSDRLLNLNIRNFFQDRKHNLWVALDAGIAMVETESPYTLFKIKQEEVKINAFAKVQQDFYAATSEGLLKYQRTATGQEAFVKMPALSYKIWDLAVVEDRLLIANEYGIHELLGNGSTKTIMAGSTPGCQMSRLNPKRLYVILDGGITSLLYDEGRWTEQELLPGFNRRVRKIIERDEHTVWLDTDWDETWRVNFSGDSGVYHWNQPELVKYDSTHGLPPERGRLYLLESQIYFVPRTLQANYIWNESSTRFEKDTLLYQTLNAEQKELVIWDIDNRGNCWYVSDYGSGREHLGVSFLQSNGKFQLEDIQCDRILDDIGNCIFVDEEVIWHGGSSSIVKQQIKQPVVSSRYHTLINRVIYQTDSVIGHSAYQQDIPDIKYRQNAILFHFSATEFVSPENLHFQTYLEGYDQSWSAWSKEKEKQYFGLEPGNYTFKVRASNSENELGEEAFFSFNILKPWYLQWWAFLLYGFWGIALISAIVKWRSNELIRENEKLEFVVQERTAEVQVRNQQLEDQKVILAQQAQKLRELDQLKTNLFANISHEFRTPLALIKAPVDQVAVDDEKTLSSDEVGMIRRNADRLLRLVNQLLDLAKLDARSLQLDLTEGDLFRFLRVEASSFSSLAAQKNIDFQIKIPTRQLWANFDRDKIETIVYNLLNNAFKFTPPEGTIILQVDHLDNQLHMEVSDNGPGIAPEHQDQVFNRFYQVGRTNHSSAGGTGIGLALCRELTNLMRGELELKSKLAKGTSFFLKLPLVEIINSNGAKAEERLLTERKEKPFAAPTVKKSVDEEIILIVEDHPEMRRYIKSVLDKTYTVMEAEDGKEGLEKATQMIPDLIITDTMMPFMDGHEFSQAIKNDERTSHIPVLMLTAKATLENKLVGLASGVDSYLTKPFNELELEASIKGLLLERKRLRKLFSGQLLVSPKEIAVNSLDQQFLQKIISILESHYVESTFGVPQLQAASTMSKTQLHRKLTATTNQSPGEFIRNFRLQRAAQILSKKGETVTQVAYAVGFENVPYFTKCFKDLFGVTPSQYGK